MLSRFNLNEFAEQRSILSDMLPFETPPSFSNSGFFQFLATYNVRVLPHNDGYNVQWDCNDQTADAAVRFIFGAEKNATIFRCQIITGGRSVRRNKIFVKARWSRPFGYRISHKTNEFRKLSIIHPAHQCFVSSFYYHNASVIQYFSSLSPFSIRKPYRVAKQIFFDDKLHKKRLSEISGTREESHKEYEYLSSYFSYQKYSNVFRFYESYLYQRSERKFGKLLRLDISKCFDSIYTHSLPWALLGKRSSKDYLGCSTHTFGGRFDALLQRMNEGETNGIVIGPEFSRIFAELILQKVDRLVQQNLNEEFGHYNNSDYVAFRYVDDYFVFFDNDEIGPRFEMSLSATLKEFKLSLNTNKREIICRPIITNLTIAKNRVNNLLTEGINLEHVSCQDTTNNEEINVFKPTASANRLIVSYKTMIKECGVDYEDIANYTFASLERIITSIMKNYKENKKALKNYNIEDKVDDKSIIICISSIFEFAFFVYAGAQKINFAIRISRALSHVIDELNVLGVDDDLKARLKKFAHDNILRILRYQSDGKSQEIETLCWLLSQKKLGRSFLIEESVLAQLFGMTQISNNKYKINDRANVLSITTHLLFIRNSARYSKIKLSIERHIETIFKDQKSYARESAELMIMYLDVLNCPFVRELTKKRVTQSMGLTPSQRASISAANPFWFTNWGGFDLTEELDKKRARQVY